MKVRIIEKGPIIDHTRRDTYRTFYAREYFIPEGQSLVYFRLDRYNIKTVAIEDIIEVIDDSERRIIPADLRKAV